MLDVYFINSPNGRKVSIMLGETGIAHNLIRGDVPGFDVQDKAFRSISANSRLPAIVDRDVDDGGGPLALFESGEILLYLAEKTGQFLPASLRGRHTALQLLFWQMAGLGPSHAQAHHFSRYAPEPSEPYATQRFWREAERLLYVMNRRLAESAYLGGDDYTIADMACWPWIEVLNVIGMEGARNTLPHLDRWFMEIAARPGVKEGLRFPLSPMMQRPGRIRMDPDVFSRAFGDELHRRARID
jgi:GST-like protein